MGIESGGSHTTALLAPGGRQDCLRAEFGPANLRLLDDDQLIQHFSAINALCQKTPAPLAGIAIGMAGARTEADRHRIRSAAAKIWPNVPCYATNDLETALVAGTPPGRKQPAAQVLILSGTGSCCFGRTQDNRTARLGGWGHIIGDKGSGYEIGLRGLKAAVHYLDRDGQWSRLGQSLLQALLLNEPEDLIDWAKSAAKQDIAALAPHVFDAAFKGDSIAAGILDGAAETLAEDGVQCARKLVAPGTPVRFILAGGVLLQQTSFATRVRALLLKLWPGAIVAPLQRESVWGALELACENFGHGHAPSAAVREADSNDGLVPVSRCPSPTEQRNPRSLKLDRLSLARSVELMIDEEAKIGKALRAERRKIERSVELVVAAFRRGGRLFYIGAGTSGRLGVLDAAECPPTFRFPAERVQGIIAGGQAALWRSVEGAEDSPEAGASALSYRGVNERDVVFGIAASGRTPFVWGALSAAKKRGARTILLCFNPHLQIPKALQPDVLIAPDVGPEVLTGSTRLKSGTATKIVLNTLTTLAMVRMGKVVSNLMIDVNASNRKLRERAVRIVQAVTGADAGAAQAALEKSKWIVKSACQRLR
ncbi:MAG TPA: N-acetylmuramic acid 6-phosphate etherase [Verrucomicrobiae bacterium]